MEHVSPRLSPGSACHEEAQQQQVGLSARVTRGRSTDYSACAAFLASLRERIKRTPWEYTRPRVSLLKALICEQCVPCQKCMANLYMDITLLPTLTHVHSTHPEFEQLM